VPVIIPSPDIILLTDCLSDDITDMHECRAMLAAEQIPGFSRP